MRKLLTLLILFATIGTVQAEITYNPNDSEHKLDNYCVGVVSFARDVLFNDVQISNGKVFLYSVEPTADVKIARLALTDLSNKLILKYAYSRQFNEHYRAQAKLVKAKSIKEGGEYLKREIEICKKRV